MQNILINPGKATIRILAETPAVSLDVNKTASFLRAVGVGFKSTPTAGKINIATGCLFSPSVDTLDVAIKLANCKALDSRFRGNDIKEDGGGQPFPAEINYEQNRLQGKAASSSPLYDGFKLANLFRKVLDLKNINTVTFVYTDRLIGSKDEGGRWHARTVIFSHPSIISVPGIVQAPARSRKYYLMKQLSQSFPSNAIPEQPLCHPELVSGSSDLDSSARGGHKCLRRNDIKSRGNDTKDGNGILDDEDYISEGDPRIEEAVNSYTLQAFYYSIFGNPFCENNDCRLFNSHWQKEMIHAQINGNICKIHKEALKEWLNIRLSA